MSARGEVFESGEWYRVAEARPRLRDDLRATRHVYLDRPWYVLTDASSGKVHRLTPAAFAFLGALDGKRTVAEVWETVVEEQGDDALSQDDAIRLLSQLHGADLLANSEQPLLSDLVERRSKERRGRIKKLAMNPLAMTIPMVDPDRFLSALVRASEMLPAFVWRLLLFALFAVAAFQLVVNWHQLSDRGLEGILDLENLILIALIYPVVKALHEIGHGIVIKAHGGEVHEMGIMLIAFYPIPYVEASASLGFASKWSRAAVAAAGVVTELAIAAIALFIWLSVEPGTVRAIAFNTMLIAGVSTVFINGNPLMKFDGYHVLSDLIEIPNLAKRGAAWWGRLVRTRLLGTTERDGAISTAWERGWFFLYTPAGYVYRIWIALTIALFVATEYRIAGMVLAAWSLALGVGWPIAKVAWSAFTDHRIRDAGGRAIVGATAGIAGVIALLFIVPIPDNAVVQGVVWLPPEAQIRARSSGVLRDVDARHGDGLEEGVRLATINAPDVEARLNVAQAQHQLARLAYSQARIDERPRAIELLEDVVIARSEEEVARSRVADLTLRAPTAGRLDMPLSDDIVGRFVREGDIVAHLIPEAAPVLRILVPQDDAGRVRDDLRQVAVRFAYKLSDRHAGRIVREVPAGDYDVPSAAFTIDGGGSIATAPGQSGEIRALSRYFQFDVALLEPQHMPPLYGMRAYVRLSFKPRPAGMQAARALRRVFLSAFAL